jgi:predicted transcriptional regulator of viral defense system
MTISEALEFIKESGGTVSIAELSANGFKRGSVQHLVNTGRLERSARGVYTLPGEIEDEFYAIQSRFRRGIFSGNTALYLWGLSDRTPLVYDMTFPSTYNLGNVKKANIAAVSAIPRFYLLGRTTAITQTGRQVSIYSRERLLCELLRGRKKEDIQVVSNAFKAYVSSQDRNLTALSSMAEELHVSQKLRAYLEVLL